MKIDWKKWKLGKSFVKKIDAVDYRDLKIKQGYGAFTNKADWGVKSVWAVYITKSKLDKVNVQYPKATPYKTMKKQSKSKFYGNFSLKGLGVRKK